MIKVIGVVSALAVLVTGVASVARAEEVAKPNELTALAGFYSVPTKITLVGQDKIADSGAAFGFRYLRNVDSTLSFGGELSFLNAGSHDSALLIPSAMTETSLTSRVFLGEVRARWGGGPLRPFLLGGIGGHSTSMKIDVAPQSGFVWSDTGTSEVRTAVDSSKISMAATLQGGIDYEVSESIRAGLYAAWYYLGSGTYAATDAGRLGGLASVKGSFSGIVIGGLLSAKF